MLPIVLILFLGGTVALILEAYLPGGILGFFGAAAVIGAAGLLYFAPEFQSWNDGLRFFGALGMLVVSGVGAWFAILHFQRTPVGRAMTLEEEIDSAAPSSALDALTGSEGTTLTALLPGGKALIGEKKADVQSEVGAIAEGTTVKVTRVEGGVVYVSPAGASNTPG